jgi:hypothetical protein
LNNKKKNNRSNCKRHVDLVGQRPIVRQKKNELYTQGNQIFIQQIEEKQMTRKINC